VFATTIDDLQSIVKRPVAALETEVERAELIVREEVSRVHAMDAVARSALPTVIALRERFEAIRLAELKRIRRCPADDAGGRAARYRPRSRTC